MAEKKHVSVRLEQETRERLELIAKRRMMATGVAVTLADLIREGLAQFADSELTEDSPAPAKPVAPAEDQPDMFDLAAGAADKPVKASATDKPVKVAKVKKSQPTRTPEEMTELRIKAQALKGQGYSERQIAEKLDTNQTFVGRKLLK